MELCKDLPVELRLQDYREVTGTFDAVISIGVMEHVGYKNYGEYMRVVDRCLKKDGIAFVHTIGGNQSYTTGEPWTDKYIFPNGLLPSMAQLSKAMEEKFVMEDWHNIGPNYDPTLMAWHANFEKAWPELKKNYDDRFYRMWRYYLLSSAGAFRARNQQLWQMVFTRYGNAAAGLPVLISSLIFRINGISITSTAKHQDTKFFKKTPKNLCDLWLGCYFFR